MLFEPPVPLGLLHRGFHYKSVATQIPYDHGLVPIPYTGWNFSPLEIEPVALPIVRVQSIIL